MLLFREKIPAEWLPKVRANLPAVLVDHAHLERKAAASAPNLLMAKAVEEAEADRRLDFYLDPEATLIREPNPLPLLHGREP